MAEYNRYTPLFVITIRQMTELDIDWLAEWLEDENRKEDCFDIHGLHGYFTALAICGEALDDQWLSNAIDQPLTDLKEDEAQEFADQCVALFKHISDELYSDDDVAVTFEPSGDYEESDLSIWCQGFMEVVFEVPDAWEHKEEEHLATLLLPIEAGSGFFIDEPDFQTLYKKPKLVKQMLDQIPELLTDLYLLFHAPTK